MSYTQLVRLERYVEEFDALLEVESERGSAVIAACFIDEMTNSLVERYETAPLLHPPQAKKKSQDGWIITKFDTLRRQEVLTEQQAAQLQLLRNIRNEFAHTMRATTFAYPEIARLLNAGAGTPREAFRALVDESSRLLYSLLYAKHEEARRAHRAHLTPRIVAAQVLARIASGETTPSFVSSEGNVSTYTADDGGAAFRVRIRDTHVVGILAFRIGSEWHEVTPDESWDDAFLWTYTSAAFPAPP